MKVDEARKRFPIGSRVVITNPGGNYSTFEWWAGRYLESYEDFLNWKLGDHSPEERYWNRSRCRGAWRIPGL